MNNQNESPFTNPKFFVAIIATFIGLWGWQYFITKNYPQTNLVSKKVTEQKDNIEANTKTQVKVNDSEVIKNNTIEPIVKFEEKEFSYEDDKAKWTISSNGMGIKTFIVKNFKDREGKLVEFSSNSNLFSIFINDKPLQFNLNKISDIEFKGETVVDGKNVVRILKFDKQKRFFESSTTFETGISNISFAADEKKLAIKSTNFLMPSFEKQDFLYKEVDKIKTEHISGLKDSEVFNKDVSNISLAAIGTQYFTISSIDKSDVLPSLSMNVASQNANLKLKYDLSNSPVRTLNQIYYIGAKDTDILKPIDPLLPEIMDYGMFGFIAKPLLILMRLMHGIFGNWGLAIIALTIIVRFIMLPFNILSFKSSRAMQKIQPILKDIREKYKSDPMEVNRRTMAVMKEHKANPLSGCLPMLIQIPIFFALWKTIGSSVEIYQQPFFGWIHDLSSHDPYFVFPILMGITMFFQQKLTPTTMDPAQQKILNFMPIIFTVFMFSLPSGLTLYNFVSALFGVTQQYFLLKDRSAAKAA